MFKAISSLWRRPEISTYDANITRERLIQNGRLVVVDDESPLLIDELRKVGFSVDHDIEGNDVHKIDAQLYDVAIIDFHGVGGRFGEAQGLDLLKHVRRVAPRTRIIAYTSRSLKAGESEFFRLSHVVLPKDLGLEESLSIIEDQLRLAFTKQHLFDALVTKLNVSDLQERERLRHGLLKALSRKDEKGFKAIVTSIAGQAAEKSVGFILDRLFAS